jgi:two-component sensor histidine kinase
MHSFPLEQALPAEIAGRSHGWFTRYRRYPVFSAAWVRGRWRSWVVVIVLFVATVAASALLDAPDLRPLGGILQLSLQVAVPFVVGPWLAWWVRKQAWPQRREGAGLVAVMVGAMLLNFSASLWLGEPMKQWVAEHVGTVDADGKRKRYMLMIGINVSSGEEAAPGSPTRAKHNGQDLQMRLANATSSALLAFWLAGGLGLLSWRRERLGLAALAQERELAQAQAQQREAELRLSVLAAQVEPHFLFNTLAGVRSAIVTDPARASAMIDGLVEYLRASIPRLRSDGGAQANVASQFDIVRAYLGLMAARMPRLHFALQLPPALAAARCPPLMLISLAENAVRHGVEPKIGAAQIEVTAEQIGDTRLRLSVADDGVGFGVSAAGGGLGLSNIRERLRQLYGSRASLSLVARPAGGVVATLELPLEFLAEEH